MGTSISTCTLSPSLATPLTQPGPFPRWGCVPAGCQLTPGCPQPHGRFGGAGFELCVSSAHAVSHCGTVPGPGLVLRGRPAPRGMGSCRQGTPLRPRALGQPPLAPHVWPQRLPRVPCRGRLLPICSAADIVLGFRQLFPPLRVFIDSNRLWLHLLRPLCRRGVPRTPVLPGVPPAASQGSKLPPCPPDLGSRAPAGPLLLPLQLGDPCWDPLPRPQPGEIPQCHTTSRLVLAVGGPQPGGQRGPSTERHHGLQDDCPACK